MESSKVYVWDDKIDEAAYCTGCDHKATDKIQPPHLGCCPDSNYVVNSSHAKKVIREALSEESGYRQGWISVEERLPETSTQAYIVRLENDTVFEMNYSNLSKR